MTIEQELEGWLRERLGGSGVAVAPPDRMYPLFPEEEAHIAQAVERRRMEFSAGRWCARRALGEIGIESGAIAVGVRMGPVWPEGVCGSITHAGGLCAAVASRMDGIAGLGIDVVDLEAAGAVLEPSGGGVAGERELEVARLALGGHAAAILFSAKESAIKAMSAAFDRYVDFTEVVVSIEGARFRARCEPFGAQAEGWWVIRSHFGFTAAVRR